MKQAAAGACPMPLQGVRIVDFTTFLSGPYCTQILGDLGADVIKVESFDGDSSRQIPPHFVGEDSAYFLSTNRNKRSIAINLKNPGGLDLARRLITESDMVVENYRPGVCKKLGLDADVLLKQRPSLIWVSISGFGQNSPWRERPAYDMTAQALSGVMSLTGEPGRSSVRLGIPAGDTIAGMYGAIAALAALSDRHRTGRGRKVDISMLDCQLSMLVYQAQYALVAGVEPGPQGTGHDSIPTYRSFVAGDGRQLVVTANTEKMWQQLCEALDLAHLPEQDAYATAAARLANKEALWAQLEPAFLLKDSATWIEELTRRGVPVAPIKTVGEALKDARQHGRDMIVRAVHDEDGHQIEMVGSPIKLDAAEPPCRFPPRLSQDAEDILGEVLGLRESAIAELRASGAVR